MFIVFAIVLVVSVVRLAATWRVFSQTTDEAIHVAAGCEWWTRGYEVDVEHPPLARILFALPAYLEHVPVDASFGRNEQGNLILEHEGRYRRNLARARMGNLPFFALALTIVMLWTRRLRGPYAAMIAVALFAALPPVLAHAGLATTDVAAAAGFAAALYAFARLLDVPTWRRALLAGVAIGIGLLSKHSFVLFFPLGAIAMMLAMRKRPRVAHAAIVVTIAVLSLWAGYKFSIGRLNDARVRIFPETSEEKIAARYATYEGYEWVRPDLVRRYWDDAHDIGEITRGGVDFVDWARAAGYPSPLAGRSGRDTMAGHPPTPPALHERLLEPFRAFRQWIAVRVPLPAPMYFAGIEYVARHSRTGHQSFLLGRNDDQGWWYYFPVVLFFKTPLPFLFLALAGLALFARERGETRGLALAALAILGASMTGGINIGVRHLLPMYPLLAIAAAAAALKLWNTRARAGVVVLLAWFFVTTTAAHPDYLAWFNACAGDHPERIVVDSNLDWGQDLLRLDAFVRREKIDRLFLGYTGSADWSRRMPWADPLPRDTPVHGWIAVSEQELAVRPGHYRWLRNDPNYRRIGKSIRLYRR